MRAVPHHALPDPDALLAAAVQRAARRFRMPALPGDAALARAAGAAPALAWAIEAGRAAVLAGAAPPAEARGLFTWGLARLVAQALAPEGGDPAFQAAVLAAAAPELREHLALAGEAARDQRRVRALVDAVAHPGKLRRRAAGPAPEPLSRLHGHAAAADWDGLRAAAGRLAADPQVQPGERQTLARLLAEPALARLERAAVLRRLAAVQAYHALRARAGPAAGSAAAGLQGRQAGRRGAAAEAEAVTCLHALAGLLDAAAPGSRHTVARGLRLPAGVAGQADGAKDEWDAALLRAAPDQAELLLLVEAKAAPAAATTDLPRLLRGLGRLARAGHQGPVRLASADGPLAVSGASLRRLRPHGVLLPGHVVYLCSAAAEPGPALLSPPARALLLAEPASVAFALALEAGGAPGAEELAPVWDAVLGQPRLRPVLHQYPTACAARAAMLHPDDLLAAARHSARP